MVPVGSYGVLWDSPGWPSQEALCNASVEAKERSAGMCSTKAYCRRQ
jgi:hypothetical protein